MNILYLIIVIIIDIFGIILSILVFASNKKKRLNQVFILMTIAFLSWITFAYLSDLPNQKENALIWNRLIFASLTIGLTSTYFFSFLFPKESKRYHKIDLVILVIGAIAFFLSIFSSLIVKNVILKEWGSDLVLGGGIYIFYFLTLLWCFSVFLIYKKFRKAIGIEKMRIMYFWIGLIIFVIMNIIFNVLLPSTRGTYQLYQFGNLSIIFYLAFTAYAITRYRLMDIKVVLRKGVIYGLSIFIALAFYTYLAILLKDYLQNTLNLTENWGIFVLILLVALGFPPLKYAVEKLITTAFFPKVKNLKKKAREIAQDISSKIKLEELVNRFASEVKDDISAHNLQVYLKNRKTGDFNVVYPAGFSDLIKYDHLLTNYFKIYQEILITEEIEYMKENENEAKAKLLENLKKELETRHIALVIPLQNLSEELDVLIFLENKKNKEAFNLEDINFLQNISSQFNIALANAILYKEALERINYQ